MHRPSRLSGKHDLVPKGPKIRAWSILPPDAAVQDLESYHASGSAQKGVALGVDGALLPHYRLGGSLFSGGSRLYVGPAIAKPNELSACLESGSRAQALEDALARFVVRNSLPL